MRRSLESWDYLIVTASNRSQALAYETQLKLREELGLLAEVKRTMVVADPEGKRIGSGGSTVYSILAVLNQELGAGSASKEQAGDRTTWLATLRKLRILVIHAGGDSRRLPAYAPCGKVFIPVPGDSDRAVTTTLFDRQLPVYLALPPNPRPGQVVVASGDVLLSFDPLLVAFKEGVTGLGCPAAPEEAARHGVYCLGPGGRVRSYLQKPDIAEQGAQGAVDRYGRSILDIGVMSLDAETAVEILGLFDVHLARDGALCWSSNWADTFSRHGLDFYREICCAMGTEVSLDTYRRSAYGAGSSLSETLLSCLYQALSRVPFHVQVLRQCSFLHFGTTAQVIESGAELLRRDRGVSHLNTCLSINNQIVEGGGLLGSNAWVESCRIAAPVNLGGQNVIAGLDVVEPLELAKGDCVDVVPAREGGQSFIRCYSVLDSFKDSGQRSPTFCGYELSDWLTQAGASAEDIWPEDQPPERRGIWEAHLFPAGDSPASFRQWLWMLHPGKATADQKREWRQARRYSLAEIASLTDFSAFYQRRSRLRAEEILGSLPATFRADSGFSAAELAFVLRNSGRPQVWIKALMSEARWHSRSCSDPGMDCFTFSRLIHTLGTAVGLLADSPEQLVEDLLPGLAEDLAEEDAEWLRRFGVFPYPGMAISRWVEKLHARAFDFLESTIIYTGVQKPAPPRSALRSDEIVWGRAPARLDLGGGWTDTPPYSLENGGRVINAAVNLNGQPPIQCYARVIDRPVIRISSIDLGTRLEITSLEGLLDYREPTGEFGLAKAALALCGFDPEAANWEGDPTLERMLAEFGGGIELTTLAAIPKGSGLGTSSIMGAVVVSVLSRLTGRTLPRRDLFHYVLRLEQALTTGGGWQDQVGGVVDGVKLIESDPGMVPDIRIHYVAADVLEPATNGGCTLLYYTGITRLAKHILQDVVGRYLDRDRLAMTTLRRLHLLGNQVADAMARKDILEFGELINTAWSLNKQLDPNSTNGEIEGLLSRLSPHLYGSKLLGAGGGGFLLMVCKSPNDAMKVKDMLESAPPNLRARFFDFDVSTEGLVVSVC
ncbi:MAG: L-fucokinase [Acidobacteriota bacterium]